MKLRKHLAVISAAVFLLLGTGCEENLDTLVPMNYYQAIVPYSWWQDYMAYPVEAEHTEFAESMFREIEVMGAHLILPMEVSDLPRGFAIEPDVGEYYSEEHYRGYCLTKAALAADDIFVCGVMILHSKDAPVTDGVIVSMRFTLEQVDKSLAEVKLGGQSPFYTKAEVEKLLGENTLPDTESVIRKMHYHLGDDRLIGFYYHCEDVEWPESLSAYMVELSVVGGASSGILTNTASAVELSVVGGAPV